MKIFAFAFAALLAAVVAVPEPQTSNERFVDNIIVGIIEDLSNDLVERGLDPFELEQAGWNYKLPVTDLFIAEAAIEDVVIAGISNIQINRINYSILTSRLQMDLSLPLVSAKVGNANAFVKLFSTELSGKLGGSLDIEQIRVTADVRINIGIISGVSIRSLDIDLSIGNIRSALEIVVFGHDLSASINNFLGVTVPNTLEQHRNDINSLLEHVIKDIIEDLL